jgi:23S rRNA pseudouridine1911/1915/1917 synthase
MAAIGSPVFGDMRYGGEKAVKGRLALWAYQLKFTHPVTKTVMAFRAIPPIDESPWKLFRTLESEFNNF